VADNVNLDAGGNIGTNNNPLDVNANNVNSNSGDDTNLDLSSPNTNLVVNAGGDANIHSSGAVQGSTNSQNLNLEADGDVGSADDYFDVTVDEQTGTADVSSNFGNVYVLMHPADFELIFDLNGGTWDGKTGIVTIIAREGTVYILPLPYREGYIFLYWLGSIYYAGDGYEVTEGHSFTAVWAKEGGNGVYDALPKTGDSAPIAVLICLVVLAAAIMTMILRRQRA